MGLDHLYPNRKHPDLEKCRNVVLIKGDFDFALFYLAGFQYVLAWYWMRMQKQSFLSLSRRPKLITKKKAKIKHGNKIVNFTEAFARAKGKVPVPYGPSLATKHHHQEEDKLRSFSVHNPYAH